MALKDMKGITLYTCPADTRMSAIRSKAREAGSPHHRLFKPNNKTSNASEYGASAVHADPTPSQRPKRVREL